MKKIILSAMLSSLFVYGQTTLSFEDLYGEVQVNSIVANQCLEEITFTRNITGSKCKFYIKTIPSTEIYEKLIKNINEKDINQKINNIKNILKDNK